MRILSLIIVIFPLLSSCDLNVPNEENISFEQTEMEALDIFTLGSNLKLMVNSQDEYNELIHQKFVEPVISIEGNFCYFILRYVKPRYPNLSNEELNEKAKEIFDASKTYNQNPNCIHPQIDFARYTLLVQSTSTTGCRSPNYKIEFYQNRSNREYVFKIIITSYGTCESCIDRNIWILVPKIPEGSIIKFETIKINVKDNY